VGVAAREEGWRALKGVRSKACAQRRALKGIGTVGGCVGRMRTRVWGGRRRPPVARAVAVAAVAHRAPPRGEDGEDARDKWLHQLLRAAAAARQRAGEGSARAEPPGLPHENTAQHEK
jgi:hypothetical protein